MPEFVADLTEMAGVHPVFEYTLPATSYAGKNDPESPFLARIGHSDEDETSICLEVANALGYDENRPNDDFCIVLRDWISDEQTIIFIKNGDFKPVENNSQNFLLIAVNDANRFQINSITPDHLTVRVLNAKCFSIP